MTKDWHKIVCLADDLGLEFSFKESYIKFYRQDKEIALLRKYTDKSNKWILLAAPSGFTRIANNPKKLVNLVAQIA